MKYDQAEELRKAMKQGREFLKNTKEEGSKEQKNEKKMKVVTITSGKGGVGKSNFIVNLATCLTNRGQQPIIMDADLGLANVEIMLGSKPKYNLGHLIKKECTIEDVISKSTNGVSYISGGSGVHEMAFLDKEGIKCIAGELDKLKEHTGLLLIDTGAGINDAVLNFCTIADEIIVVVVPEPSSIADSYSLIKTLKESCEFMPAVKIVVNKATSEDEADRVYARMKLVCKEFLELDIEYLGIVPYDDQIPNSAKQQMPVVSFNKKTAASKAYFDISLKLENIKVPIEAEETKPKWIDRFVKIFNKD